MTTETKPNKMTHLTNIGLQISKDLKADVKIKCAKEGKTIREVIEQLLTEWVKK